MLANPSAISVDYIDSWTCKLFHISRDIQYLYFRPLDQHVEESLGTVLDYITQIMKILSNERNRLKSIPLPSA